MKTMKIAGMIFLIVLCAGCSSYQLAGTSMNTMVQRISQDTFSVNFCGNAYMNAKDAEKYAFQRAAEVTLSKGYSHFVVLTRRDDSQQCTLNDPGEPNSLDSSLLYVRPNVTLTFQCFSGKQKMPADAIDARHFLGSNFPGLDKQQK